MSPLVGINCHDQSTCAGDCEGEDTTHCYISIDTSDPPQHGHDVPRVADLIHGEVMVLGDPHLAQGLLKLKEIFLEAMKYCCNYHYSRTK